MATHDYVIANGDGATGTVEVGTCIVTCDDDTACNYGEEGDCEYESCASACADGQTEVVLTAMDSYGDGWNGNIANVYFDGVLYDKLQLSWILQI